MTEAYYKLPPDLAANIDTYEQEIRQFLAGDMSPEVLRAKRVPRGVYEQRQDGAYMVRVRVAGGSLATIQARELANLATEYGNNHLHVTTRQDVQLHDISLENTPVIMRRLMEVGLASLGGGGNTVRNVAACPYAGICSRECFDVTPMAHAVTEYLIALTGSYNLPRKYKIAFSGCAADCALAQVADLGFIAEIQNGQPGFRIMAGGGMGAHSRVADKLLDWIPVADVIRVAEAVRQLFDKFGDRSNKHRARLRYVFERIGSDAFREHFSRQMQLVTDQQVPAYEEVPTLNEENDKNNRQWQCHPLSDLDGVRCFRQRQQGFVAIPLQLPLGFVSADDFAKIAALAERYSEENGLRTMRSQNILIRYVRRNNLRALADELQNLDTDFLTPAPLQRFVTCAGAATCRLGLCLAREAVRACADELAHSAISLKTLEDMDIHINGCPNACGQQPVAPIGLYGVAQRFEDRLMPCYKVTFGGRCSAEGARLGVSAGQIPAKAMPQLLVELANDFQTGRRDGETFSSYFERKGQKHFEKLVSPHTKIPSYSDRPEFYRDFGTEKDFSLAGIGAGECGAGVFEVIRKDLATARKAQEPWEILQATVRALLITRGVDAREPGVVLREFEKHFIDTGLVSDEYRDLLSRARGYTQGWKQAFEGYEKVIDSLLERVELLYSTLDAKLEFHPPEKGEQSTDAGRDEAQTEESVSRREEATENATELDLRGVDCPLNFVKAKLQLETMDIGDRLAVVLDNGDPVQNVPASFRNEGQTIEKIADLHDGHWQVIVRKEK